MATIHPIDCNIESPIVHECWDLGDQTMSLSEPEPIPQEDQYPSKELFQYPSNHTDLPPFPQQLDFQDCEVDFLTWSNSFQPLKHYHAGVVDAEPSIKETDALHANGGTGIGFGDDEPAEMSQEESASCWGFRSRDEEKRRPHGQQSTGRLRSPNSIDFDEIKMYFYMPITQAAKELRVGLTVLKKRCRELGISRWPSRKMNSLRSLIHNVKRVGDNEQKIQRLEELKSLLEGEPEIQLNEETKKLRQACFKANYKRRITEATVS